MGVHEIAFKARNVFIWNLQYFLQFEVPISKTRTPRDEDLLIKDICMQMRGRKNPKPFALLMWQSLQFYQDRLVGL